MGGKKLSEILTLLGHIFVASKFSQFRKVFAEANAEAGRSTAHHLEEKGKE